MAWVKIADRSTLWEYSGTTTPHSYYNSTAGRTITSDYRMYWRLYYDNNQSIANNTTQIKIEYCFQYTSDYNSGLTVNPTAYSNVVINGSSNTKTCPSNFYNVGVTQWDSIEKTISHDSNGTGSFTFRGIASGTGFNNSTSTTTYSLPQIPRATTINSFTWAKASGGAGLSSLTCNWATAHSIDRIQYSFNGGAYTTVTGSGTSGNFSISSLTPNTQYSMKIKVRRADSQVETESGTLNATTYDIAKITGAGSSYTINIGDAFNVAFTNPSGATTNLGILKTDGATVVAAYRAITTSPHTYTPSAEEITAMYNLIPTTTSISLRVCLTTSDGLGGSWLNYVIRTFQVVDANPTFTTWTYADTNATTVALTGNNQKIIKGYSNVKATITSANKAVGIKGATATSYQLTIGTKPSATVAYSPSATVEMTVNAVDNNVFNCYAIDSRGNSTNVPKTLTTDYINYTPISITSASATRTDNIGEVVTLTYNGTFYNDSFGSTTNTIKSATYKYKKTTESTYTDGEADSITPTPSGNTFSFSGAIKGDKGALGFDATYSYNIQVIVTDELSTKTFTFLLGSGTPNISISQNGVAINQAYDETLGGALQVNGEHITTGSYNQGGYNAPTKGALTQVVDNTTAQHSVIVGRRLDTGARLYGIDLLDNYSAPNMRLYAGSNYINLGATTTLNNSPILTEGDIIDTLVSTSATDALSANQGKVLKGEVDTKLTQAGTVVATLNDDTAMSVTPPAQFGVVIVYGRHANYRFAGGLFSYRCATTNIFCEAIAIMSATERTAGALTGTTGTDGKFTVSAHTDGKIYFENRMGFAISFGYIFMGS